MPVESTSRAPKARLLRFAAFLLAFCACQVSETSTSVDRHHHGSVDAAVSQTDSSVSQPDASQSTEIVTCYSEGNPGATCTLPVHCCFTGYDSAHDGYCTTETCAFGTISCDGPEDCASGSPCCAHSVQDPTDGTIGIRVACEAGGCAPHDIEVCHSTCSHGTCVSASGHDNDLPRTLNICQ